MGKEIEKKFLVRDDHWRGLAPGVLYRQGYLNKEKGRTVRVRTVGDQGFLTIKGPSIGGARPEYEYPIPLDDAVEILEHLCLKPLIEKTRTKIPYQGFIWEIDEFKGKNQGLILAEIELTVVEETFAIPPWIGTEVTGDSRYYNANLVHHPYSAWKHEVHNGANDDHQ
jgi:adenylate cyclase